MRTRSFRRFKQLTKVKRRVEMYAAINWMNTSTREEFRQQVKGRVCSWIRTTGKPCSCNLCSYYKYKRETKVQVDKIISQHLE